MCSAVSVRSLKVFEYAAVSSGSSAVRGRAVVSSSCAIDRINKGIHSLGQWCRRGYEALPELDLNKRLKIQTVALLLNEEV